MKRSQGDIETAAREAHLLRGDFRSMRVTLECAHMRLMPRLDTIMGIGARTACMICPMTETGTWQSRLVVNIEETGVLDIEQWSQRGIR